MTTINMHMKFEIEIPKQTWLMLRKPCRLQTDGRTDGRTRWNQYTLPPPPPSNFVGRGYKYIHIYIWKHVHIYTYTHKCIHKHKDTMKQNNKMSHCIQYFTNICLTQNSITADYNIFSIKYCLSNFENSYSLIFLSIPRLRILFQIRTPWKRRADLPNSVLTQGTW